MTTSPAAPQAAITKAFVLAAGLGARMRPLTDNCPKPLLYVGGRTMLDRTLDALAAAGVTDVVVNVHYLGEMIEAHLGARKDLNITVSREETLLDTGGGVQKMIEFFGDEAFYVLNADVVWTDGPDRPTLAQMARAWDGTCMDVLLLLHTTEDLPAYAGQGDYYLPEGGDRPAFAKSEAYVAAGKPPANYIFAGPRIVHPRLFRGVQPGVFSFRDLFLAAEAQGRLFAVVHDGAWHHVGTPEAYEKTNQLLAAAAKKRAT